MPNQNYTTLVQSRFQMTPESLKADIALSNFFLKYGEYQDRLNRGERGIVRALIRDWRTDMGYIVQGFQQAGRRVLLEWLIHQAEKQIIPELILEKGNLVYPANKTTRYQFPATIPVDAKLASDMSTEEARAWCSAIRDVGKKYSGSCSKILPVIKKAFGLNPTSAWLTKEQAFTLGHYCAFSIDEMGVFLSKTFQDGVDGAGEEYAHVFFSKSSRDLIEYYSFLFRDENDPLGQPERLYERYLDRCGNIPKRIQDGQVFTDVTELSMQMMQSLSAEKPMSEEKFLDTIVTYAPYLDEPSVSDHDLYQRILQVALLVIKQEKRAKQLTFQDMPEMQSVSVGQMEPVLQRAIMEQSLWLHEDEFEKAADTIAMTLYERDNESAIPGKRTYIRGQDQLVQTMTYTKQGDAMTLPVGVMRIKDLLKRKVSVHKNDVLFMLFFAISTIVRIRAEGIELSRVERITDIENKFDTSDNRFFQMDLLMQNAVVEEFEKINEQMDVDEQRQVFELLLDGLSSFTSVAGKQLKESKGLGVFYTPHFTEYSMLSALVASAITAYSESPMNWYLRFVASRDRDN